MKEKKNKKLYILGQLVFLAVAYAAQAQSTGAIYVATNGSDTTGNGTISNPYQKLEKAYAMASSGNEIVLRAGTYPSGMITILGKDNLVFRSHDNERAVIDFDPTTDQQNGFWVRANNPTFKNLDIKNADTYNIKFEGRASFNDPPHTKSGGLVDGCKISDSGNDLIKITDHNNVIVKNSELFWATVARENAQGVDAVASHDTLIQNNYFHDIRDVASHVKGGAKNGIIERNLYVDVELGPHLGQTTDEDQIDYEGNPLGYESIDGIARNNVIINADYAGIASWMALRPQIYNNTIINAGRIGQAGLLILNLQGGTPPKDAIVRNNIIVNTVTPETEVVQIKGAISDDLVANYIFSNNRYYDSFRPANFERITGNNMSGPFEQWKVIAGESGSSVGNPMLDPTSYKPLSGSPVINAGFNLGSLVPNDKDGNVRPNPGGTYDIGAYEVDSVSTSLISLTKAVSPAAVQAGGQLTYVIAYRNDGSQTALDVKITDVIPSGTTLVPGSIDNGGSFDSATKTASWNLGAVAAGASGSVSFKVTVN